MTKENVLTENNFKESLKKNENESKAIVEDIDKFEELIQNLEKTLGKLPGVGPYVSDIMTLVSLARSYIKKEYTEVPFGTVISIVSTILYIVSPVDLIPDVIPGVGYVDDMALVVWILSSIHDDVELYKKWRIKNNKTI